MLINYCSLLGVMRLTVTIFFYRPYLFMGDGYMEAFLLCMFKIFHNKNF